MVSAFWAVATTYEISPITDNSAGISEACKHWSWAGTEDTTHYIGPSDVVPPSLDVSFECGFNRAIVQRNQVYTATQYRCEVDKHNTAELINIKVFVGNLFQF